MSDSPVLTARGSGFTAIQAAAAVFFGAAVCAAKLPGELPGQEITEEEYFDHTISRDSIAKTVPAASPSSPNWLDSAARTWDAPPVATQMAEDDQKLQLGMGAVFIPRMSDAEAEPDIEILDQAGDVQERGKPGRKYNLVPGTYYVLIGSGSHKQRIVKTIDVAEGRTLPVVPDWAGLTINVVDEANVPFRGEYELARIDKFEPYGRGYGSDPDLGEEVQTWVLRPGLYKIFPVGQSYNTLTNFITVRLLPGEYVDLLLVQDENDMTIRGGGTVSSELDRSLASNWRYGVDVGGSIDFNAVRDRLDETQTKTNISVSMLSRLRLKYEKERVEWDSRLYVDEGVLYLRKEERLESQFDEMRLMSLYTWRILKWLGPYGRFEGETEIVPEYDRAPGTVDQHYFIVLNRDSTFSHIDSLNGSYLLQPAFSPLILEAGVGANMRIVNIRFIESRLLAGIGFTQESRFREADMYDSSSVVRPVDSATDAQWRQLVTDGKSVSFIRPLGSTTTRPEYGPEAALYVILRLGRFGMAESEFKIFVPVERMREPDFKPDVQWRGTVSWKIYRSITLDYQVQYNLRWPAEVALQEEKWLHRVLLRFSYTSR